MLRRAIGAASFGALVIGLPVFAQDAPSTTTPEAQLTTPFRSPVLTINQQAMFEQSAYGKASLVALETALRELQVENRKIEAALEAEERSLTARRETIPADEFRPLAEAFDAKVEQIRNAQDAKSNNLNLQRDQDRQRFFEAAVPVLAEFMREMGAVALLDQSAVILSLDRIDITDAAIARIDVRLAAPQPDETKP